MSMRSNLQSALTRGTIVAEEPDLVEVQQERPVRSQMKGLGSTRTGWVGLASSQEALKRRGLDAAVSSGTFKIWCLPRKFPYSA